MSVTHVIWRVDSVEFVDPEGYDPANLVELDPDWTGPFMVPDFDNQTFVPDLDAARAAQWEAVKAFRDAKRYCGCDTALGRIDTDLESQHKVNGAVTMAMLLGPAFAVNWTMEDNSTVTHDADAMKAAGLAVGAYDAGCHAVAVALRAQIDAAETVEAIMAIDPAEAVWPE